MHRFASLKALPYIIPVILIRYWDEAFSLPYSFQLSNSGPSSDVVKASILSNISTSVHLRATLALPPARLV